MSTKLEVIYGPDFDMTLEKNMVCIDNDFITFDKPIKFLERSIAACIGLSILKYINTEKIKNPFGDIFINISNETIILRTNMNTELINKFVEICENCYITNHLNFSKKLINNGEHIKTL